MSMGVIDGMAMNGSVERLQCCSRAGCMEPHTHEPSVSQNVSQNGFIGADGITGFLCSGILRLLS